MWISMTSTIALWERKESVYLSGKREDRVREGGGGIVEGRKGERKRENGEIAWAKERKKKVEKENS